MLMPMTTLPTPAKPLRAVKLSGTRLTWTWSCPLSVSMRTGHSGRRERHTTHRTLVLSRVLCFIVMKNPIYLISCRTLTPIYLISCRTLILHNNSNMQPSSLIDKLSWKHYLIISLVFICFDFQTEACECDAKGEHTCACIDDGEECEDSTPDAWFDESCMKSCVPDQGVCTAAGSFTNHIETADLRQI